MIHSLGNINSPLLEPPSSPFIGSGGTHSVLGNLDDNDREDLTSLARNSFSKGYMLFEKRKNINMTCSDSDSVPPSPSSAPPLKKSPRFSSRKSPSSPSADFTTTSVADKRYTVPQHQQLQQQQWKNCKDGCSTNSSSDPDKTIRIPWKQKNATKNIHKTNYNSDKTNDSDNSLPTTVADVVAPVTKQQTALTSSSSSQITTTTSKAAAVVITNTSTSTSTSTNTNTNTNTNKNNNRRTKVVKFNRRVRKRYITMLDNMSVEDIESMYYSKEEMVDLRNALRGKIRALVLQGGVSRDGVGVGVGVGVGGSFKNNDKDDDGRLLCHRHYNFEANYCDCDYDCDCGYDDGNCNCGDDDDFCTRGIEHEFPQGKFRRRQNKRISRSVVFEEQRLQREFCGLNNNKNATTAAAYDADADTDVVYEDPVMAIAELYRMESTLALQYALDAAKRDEFCAKRIYAADADADADASSSSFFDI